VNLLAFDSTAPILTVGITSDGRKMGRWDTPADRSRGGTLDRLISRALEESGLSRGDINALALVTGPGSLTALRIGWATVCGWALTTGIPVTGWTVPVAQRRKWAGETVPGRSDSQSTRSTNVNCLVHHRGAEFYVYDWNAMSTGGLPIVTTRDDFHPIVNSDAWIVGPGLLHNYDDWLRTLPDGVQLPSREEAIVGGDQLAVWGHADIANGRTLDLTESPLDYGLPPSFRKAR